MNNQPTWQLCPKCNGRGEVSPIGISNLTLQVCNVCNGAKIISTLTGLPPGHAKYTLNKPLS